MTADLVTLHTELPRYRLELDDASQVQIARVIRGIWGRNRGLRRRQEVVKALETKYRENPYHPLHRRNVLRVLKAKYAPLFMAQDISARRIQARTRRFLYYARIRWSLENQRTKFLQQLVCGFCPSLSHCDSHCSSHRCSRLLTNAEIQAADAKVPVQPPRSQAVGAIAARAVRESLPAGRPSRAEHPGTITSACSSGTALPLRH